VLAAALSEVVPKAAQVLLSLVLICSACVELSLESPSTNYREVEGAWVYLTNPNSVFERAVQFLMEGPAQDLRAGQSIVEGVVRTNAASADRWASLGGLLVKTGHPDKGQYCLLRAIELAPNTADTAISVANFYIDRKQFGKALPYLGRVLGTTNRSETVFNAFDTMQLSFNDIVANGGIPDRPGVAEGYFQHLLENGDLANSREAWDWLKARTPDDQLAQAYLDFLLARGHVNDAAEVWRWQMGTRWPDFGKTSFVLNGDFEHQPNGPLFDWRIAPDPHVEASCDNQVARSGSASLRLDFDGKVNSTFEGVSQSVFVPRGTYRFEAFVRTSGITTDEGIGFRVRNRQVPSSPRVETERIKGTNDWKRLEGKFVIDAPVAVIEIAVFRRPSLRFDSLIAGTAWIDQVSVTPVN